MSDLPQTERANPRTADLDTLPVRDVVGLLLEDQQAAARSVIAVADRLTDAVEAIAQRMSGGGTLHYVGAGTSGRLGVLDASEMPPTFGTHPSRVCAHIAGGQAALTAAIEGAEDDAQAGAAEMRGHVKAGDAVVGISAGGGARFVISALEQARAVGAYTVSVSSVAGAPIERAAQLAIALETGPEALTGSTRLKAGTAQKILLNTLSTAVMIRLEKTYGNLMVDVVATNDKLRARALRLVRDLAQVGEEQANDLLQASNWNVKIAVIMARANVDAVTAASLLVQNGGSLRRSLAKASG